MAPIRTSKTSGSCSTCHSREEINIVNNAELQVNAQTILAAIHEVWSKNISGAYEPKQEKFKVS
jgi:hypothetical protein